MRTAVTCSLVAALLLTGCQALIGIDDVTHAPDAPGAGLDGGGGDLDGPALDGGGLDGSVPDAGLADGPPPRFKLLFTPESPRVVRGGSTEVTVSVVPIEGALASVTVSLVASETGIAAEPIVISGVSDSLTIYAEQLARLGPWDVQLHGQEEGSSATVTRDLTLLVAEPPGALDQTFGGDGMVTLQVTGTTDIATAVAIEPDGKVVVGGTAGGQMVVARFGSDGLPDPGFAGGAHWLGPTGELHGLALQADGRIVVVGAVGSQIAVIRLNADGTIDESFDFSQSMYASSSVGRAAFVMADGTIVVAGGSSNGGPDRATVFWVNPDGLLDTHLAGPDSTSGWAIAQQANGAIVVTGSDSSSMPSLLAMRVTGLAALDPSFASDGTVAFAPTDCPGKGGALASDGGILIVGGCSSGSASYAVGKVTSDGILDTSFDGDGYARARFAGGSGSVAEDVVVADDGKIVVAGWASSTYAGGGGIARHLPDGTLDTSFGEDRDGDGVLDGMVTFGGVDYGTKYQLKAVAIAPDGRIVAVGKRADVGMLVVRVWN